MIAKQPQRTYKLGDPLPSIPGPVASWPWRASPALTKWSVDVLRYPLGTIITDVVDGHPVIAQIQTHSWYGAHPDWPATPHKGTSVFVPTTVDASGKRVAIADPPDGWGEESPTSAGYGPYQGTVGQPAGMRSPMESISRNGRPAFFGVGENFCPTLPYNCPPRPWEPDPGPRVSIADRLGTGAPPPAVPAAPDAQIRSAVQASVRGRPQAAHPAVQLSIRAAADGAARAALAARPGAPPAQVHELARRGAESAVLRASAGHRSAVVTDLRHPTVSAAVHAAAHEAALAHAWRPEWGHRPEGFGTTRWRPEWGERPAWFGARRWRGEWGAQPAWWTAQQAAMEAPQPDQPNGSEASAASPDDATAPGDTSPAPSAASGLSTRAKVGIGVAAVAVVGGTVVVLAARGGKKKKPAQPAGASS